MPRTPQFFTSRDAAKKMNVSSAGVDYWIAQGWLVPDATTMNNRPLFLPDTVRDFMALRKQSGAVTRTTAKRRRSA